MKKVFTMKELELVIQEKQVLLVNPKHIERLELLRGELVFHNKRRDKRTA
jgi:hypothetical protein